MKQFFINLAKKERSASNFALACSVGIYIALSPFMGLHTIMIFFFAWLLRLNLPITFAVAYLNNPWTVGPLIVGEYWFGQWMFSLVSLDNYFSNPEWLTWMVVLLRKYINIPDVNFWAFFMGANVLSVVVSIMLYPVFKYMFSVVKPSIRVRRRVIP